MSSTHTTRGTKFCEAFILMGNVTMIKNNFHNMIIWMPYPSMPKISNIGRRNNRFWAYVRAIIDISSWIREVNICNRDRSRHQQERIALKLKNVKWVKAINTHNSFKEDLMCLLRFDKTDMRMKFKKHKVIFGKLTHT